MPIIGASKAGGFNANYGGSTIYVDISDLMETIEHMKGALSDHAFHEMMRRTFNDAGRKVKTIMRQEVPKDYEVGANWVGSMVQWPKSRGLGVVVPIKGKRGSIGGRFHATGGSFARKGYTTKSGKVVKAARVNKKIRAKIVKGQASAMPDTMDHQGGQPPFMINGVAFTRKLPNRAYPIVRVVGLGVPQMPINRSREEVQEEIREVISKRLQHHFTILMGK